MEASTKITQTEKELFNQKSSPDEEMAAIKIRVCFFFLFVFGCSFSKTSDSDQLHQKTYLKHQMKKQFYVFKKLKYKTGSFSSIYFHSPDYLYTWIWMESIAKRLFYSEFKSLYNCNTNWGSGGYKKEFPLFIFIHTMILKGNYVSFEASLSGKIQWNKLWVWSLDSRWQRRSICSESSQTNPHQNYRTADYRNLE